MEVGILGGSFDPVHAGHLHVARTLLALGEVDRIELVVAARPPHKAGGCQAGFSDRVEMARVAADKDPAIGVLDLEGRRDGPSYTFYTVTELSQARPLERFTLLVGADMLADLPRWHRAAELVAAVPVLCFARPGFDVNAARKAFFAAFGAQARFVEVSASPVSSTEIRERLADGRPLDALVDPAVEAYIHRRGLYLRG